MQKKIDYQNFRLQSRLSKAANEIMTMHPVRKEWRIAIVSLLIIKTLTMFFSLFGGYAFFDNKFTQTLHGLLFAGYDVTPFIKVVTVITLLAIEILTAVFLQKMFKFLFRSRFITGAASAAVVILFYGISFVSSTEGLASRQAEKFDKSGQIAQNTERKTAEFQTKYDALLSDVDKQISLIEQNPAGWTNGKKDGRLTPQQLRKIDNLNGKKDALRDSLDRKILVIEREKQTELSQNQVSTAKTAKDYHTLMSIIMGIQFLATGIIIFFWHLIRTQESKDAVMSEDLTEVVDTMESKAKTLSYNTFVDTSNRIHHSINERMQQNKYSDYQSNPEPSRARLKLQNNSQTAECETEELPETKQAETIKDLPETKLPEPVKVNGFNAQLNDKKTLTKNPVGTAYAMHTDKNTLAYLRKHKQVVKAILDTVPSEKITLTNEEVRQIQGIAYRAEHKSDGLIRKVYEAVKTAGYNDVFNKI